MCLLLLACWLHHHSRDPPSPCHLPTPITDPGGFNIEGGFPGLASALLDAANATLNLGAEVRSVAGTGDLGRLRLAWTAVTAGPGRVAGPRSDDFDGVVLATPLEGSGPDVSGVPGIAPRFPRSYVPTVTTLVLGKVRASYFGQPAVAQLQYGARSV